MCCLGFASIAAGWKPKDIRGQAMPACVVTHQVCQYDLKVNIPEALKKLIRKKSSIYYADSRIGAKLAGINDDTTITDSVREKKLKKLAAKIGIRFKFID